jgi:hypothetical protein
MEKLSQHALVRHYKRKITTSNGKTVIPFEVSVIENLIKIIDWWFFANNRIVGSLVTK